MAYRGGPGGARSTACEAGRWARCRFSFLYVALRYVFRGVVDSHESKRSAKTFDARQTFKRGFTYMSSPWFALFNGKYCYDKQ